MGNGKQETIIDQTMSDQQLLAEMVLDLEHGLRCAEFFNDGTAEDWEAIFHMRQILALARKRFGA